MLNFRDISLRRKQTLIIMLTSSVALLLACTAFVAYDIFMFRREMVESTSSLAEVVGNNLTAAIDFNDPDTAAQTLAALRGEPKIVLAQVHTPDGQLFATYTRDGAMPPPEISPPQVTQHEFTANHLHLFRPIMQGDQRVGTIRLIATLEELRARLWSYAGIAGLVLIVSLGAAFGLSNQLQKLISDPILHLAQTARAVALDKDYSVRATKTSNDELGQLVDGFNEMLGQIQTRDTALQSAQDELEDRVLKRTAELEQVHRQLLEASRLGGMAEIATNVLHNVGNTLNSINVSTSLITESVKKSRVANLARVVSLLEEHAADLGTFIAQDPRGKQVPVYLSQLSEHLLNDQKATIEELESLRRNVEHIKEIVAMQQSYAKVGGFKETVDVIKLVEDSLRMNENALNRHHVDVVKEYEPVPPMTLEKHKVLQILVNLLRNAKYACDESGREDKCLTVRVSNGAGRIKIAVADNGVGIPAENMTRIFNHGFTTRKEGHGFGLHSGALAAKEMGGSLTVASGGLGQGAVFTLELPYTITQNSHE